MVRYSSEFKEQIVRKMMPPSNQTVARISRETGIAAPTLYSWRNQFRTQGHVVPASDTNPEGWNWKTKAAAVIATQSMNEAEKAEYCRKNGLYIEQLEAWESAFEVAEDFKSPTSKAQEAAARKKVKQLEKELRRKDKALAEAAALLVLSKKVQAIWGTQEEE